MVPRRTATVEISAMVHCRRLGRETMVVHAAGKLHSPGNGSCELCKEEHGEQYACQKKP